MVRPGSSLARVVFLPVESIWPRASSQGFPTGQNLSVSQILILEAMCRLLRETDTLRYRQCPHLNTPSMRTAR